MHGGQKANLGEIVYFSEEHRGTLVWLVHMYIFMIMTVDTSCILVEIVHTTKHYNLASRESGWGHIHPTNHAHIVIPSMGLMLVGNSMLCSASTNTGPDISKLGLSPATQT